MIVSFENCLKVAMGDDLTELMALRVFDTLMESSMSWTDEQRILFLTKLKHKSASAMIHYGKSVRVLRTSVAAGAGPDLPEDTDDLPPAYRAALAFLNIITLIGFDVEFMNDAQIEATHRVHQALMTSDRPMVAHIRWYAL